MEKILILDFGSQTTQLIGRRIRELGIYSEIVPGESDFDEISLDQVKGLIFSGSPFSVYDEDAPLVDKRFYSAGIPILGICYGFHRMTVDHGGEVQGMEKKEYGRSSTRLLQESVPRPGLFHEIPDGFISWMSHGDSIAQLGEGFSITASSENHPAAAVNILKRFFGIQFHPEVTHCEYGNRILENFCAGICGVSRNWSMEQYLETIDLELKNVVGTKDILLLISGGVDSTVVAALLLKVFNPRQIHLMYIDTGLMRKNETAEVEKSLKLLGAENIYSIDAEDRFLSKLKGVEDPEKKREIIGDLFVTIQQDEIFHRLGEDYFLAQGTLYTDMIESGKGIGKKAQVIKSHHNVRSPLIEKKRNQGMIIEPLSRLYKDEVRILGSKLGLQKEIVGRHPFPGPGLGVRILGEVTKEKCNILREADALFIQELKSRGLYDDIWQAFSVLLPVRSVGVTGDARRYGYVLALRAIVSIDGMTADVYPFDTKSLLEISSLITNSVFEIGRVVYDISSKPPATIEWE